MRLKISIALWSAMLALVATAGMSWAQEVQITSPSNGQTVSGTVAFAATAAPDVQWVNFYVDDNYRSSSPPYAYSWDSTGTNGGRHTLSVNAYNAAHQLVGSAQVSVTVTAPNATTTGAPGAVTLTAPTNDASVSGSVAITANAGAGVSWVNIYVDGTYLSSSPPYSFTWDASSASNGAHTITVRGYNTSNQEIGSDSVNVTVGSGQAATAAAASASSAAQSVSKPGGSGQFTTLTSGSSLPSDSECAAQVAYSSWEPRPQNDTANHTTPTSSELDSVANASVSADGGAPASYFARVTGNFTGTTDEILQWGACKWGFDVNVVRAIAANESWWRQSADGDDGVTFGILQIKSTDYTATAPMSQESTAFNVDWKLAYQRACFDGKLGYLQGSNGYPSSDSGTALWGCVGQWYSGQWYDSGAQTYISQVKTLMDNRVWEEPGF